jgi:hypothetical protein
MFFNALMAKIIKLSNDIGCSLLIIILESGCSRLNFAATLWAAHFVGILHIHWRKYVAIDC